MSGFRLARCALRWGAFLLACLASPAGAGVTLETDHLRLEIGEDATVRSLVSRRDQAEYAVVAPPCPVAMVFRGGRMVPVEEGKYAAVTGRWVYRGGEQCPATSLRREKDLLILEFAEARARATCRIKMTGDYLAWELLSVEGQGIDRIEFLRLRIRRLESLGEWMGAVYDEAFGVCLCGNLETDVDLLPEEADVWLTAAAESGVGFRGPAAILSASPHPKTGLLEIMGRIERDFGFPAGVANRRSPLQRLSYLWASNPTPQNIDSFIRYAKLGGFRMLLLSYTAFSQGAGHFNWNQRYPGGLADLQRVTAAIRSAGLKLGLHIHYSKASKTDRYVTPVPDDRLHVVRRFRLSCNVAPDASELPVEENPAGCTMDEGRRILKLGSELVEYQGYAERPPFRFQGCRRGHLGTTAAGHQAGSDAGLLDVDTWPAFIRFDQNTDIQDEVARTIAGIFRETGPYDMVYFDGAEDVHEPFWYQVASAQQRVYRLLEPPPVIGETATYTRFGWHMMTRANAYDAVAAPEAMKDFCRLMPCPTAAARQFDFSRIDFGWLGRFGEAAGGAAGPDVYEYVVSRAAAWDCPVSLHATLRDLQTNPRAEDCLAVFKRWEDARLQHQITPEQRERLRNILPGDAHYVPCFKQRENLERLLQNRDLTPVQRRILAHRREHHLIQHEQGCAELVEIEEVTGVAGGAVKAFLFQRAGREGDSYAWVWAKRGECRLRVSVPRLAAMRPFGSACPCLTVGDVSEVTVGPCTYLVFSGIDRDHARQCLRDAVLREP